MRKVDWKKAKGLYFSNQLLTLRGVAEALHVAAITIRIRARKEKWFRSKQEIYRQVDERLREFETEQYIEKLVTAEKIAALSQ